MLPDPSAYRAGWGRFLGSLERPALAARSLAEHALTDLAGAAPRPIAALGGVAIGEKIAAARRRAGLTQQGLADRLPVHRTTICAWEADRTQPGDRWLPRLNEVLGTALVTVEQIPSSNPPAC